MRVEAAVCGLSGRAVDVEAVGAEGEAFVAEEGEQFGCEGGRETATGCEDGECKAGRRGLQGFGEKA